jgi:hypothetical protein
VTRIGGEVNREKGGVGVGDMKGFYGVKRGWSFPGAVTIFEIFFLEIFLKNFGTGKL